MGDMNCAEDFLRFALAHVLKHCGSDLAFLAKHYDKELVDKLTQVAETPFARITYTEAIDMLKAVEGVAWEYPPTWGEELHTEHEKYLAEVVFKKPLIVRDYPK